MKIFLALALMSSVAFSTQTFSRGGGLDFKDSLFWGSDLNRNEQLDIKEAQNIYNLGNPKVFSKYDKSGEGVITKFEFYDYLNARNKNE